MTNRTVHFIKPFCSAELSADECAHTVFNAKRLGRNWKEINQKLNIGIKKERSKVNILHFFKNFDLCKIQRNLISYEF